ncbi:uncharacterized protein MELLADRAFT_87524 [Melampsora larici-populina 98AG31]|uniref:Selenoprotein O n=1 Tax=Melampsora larici-populina (strain 98AG31 / pathotype 3-4-7) TaxID=747676 RepID=F4RNN0_MELLP|nr:uncharacterized protein MELLADRAFT_87524 [Melampsora larici-populina 98AG31]EGG06011.1 hypothetical protein MELLADRAFT_87524 [Melampsora larici-populina 98AG31]
MKQLSNRSILNLPISTSIIHYLSSDPIVPSISKLFSIHQSNNSTSIKPSNLRRSRQVNATFSFVTPLPISFPYQIPQTYLNPQSKPESVSLDEIESYLSQFEPNPNHPIQTKITSNSHESLTPLGFTSQARQTLFQSLSPELLSLSYKSIQDCLPNLIIGINESSEERIELIKVLSGEIVLGRLPETVDRSSKPSHLTEVEDQDLIKQKGFGPWSLAYAGHQFGFFAGQLGDGRAISILSTPTTESILNQAFNLTTVPSTHQIKPKIELQLKGAGRTPFSRFADGLAVLRSSIREYLGTEFSHSLYGFPTSRSMSLISLSNLQVQRESMESGAIVSRLAPSWIRIGNFELFRFREDWKKLMDLIRFVGVQVFGFSKDQPDLGLKVFKEIMIRNAMMVAAWQAWGFMHGVINTDNVSILGITIDFGPYAFMDIYDPNHICNKSDENGRYDFKSQPEMIKFSLKKLGESLNEWIGFETLQKDDLEKKEFVELMKDDLEFRKKVKEIGQVEVLKVLDGFDEIYLHQYDSIMIKRLGLEELKPTDHKEIIKPLLDLMKDKLDYSNTIKKLNHLPNLEKPNAIETETELTTYITELSTPPFSNPNQNQNPQEDFKRWKDWIHNFIKRKQENHSIDVNDLNPKFILRQWILEEIIQDPKLINLILGLINGEIDESDPRVQRFLEVGDRKWIGFQCSCSS